MPKTWREKPLQQPSRKRSLERCAAKRDERHLRTLIHPAQNGVFAPKMRKMNGSFANPVLALMSSILLATTGCSNDTAPGQDTPGAPGAGQPGSTAPGNPGSPTNPDGSPVQPGGPTGPGGPDTDTSPQGPGPGQADIPNNNPACQNMAPVGHFVGDIAPNATLIDHLGRSVNLHDFCEYTLLVLAGASTCPTCNDRARIAARLMRDRFNDGRVKLIYMLSVEGTDEQDPTKWVPATLENAKAFHEKHQFGPNALTLVDGQHVGTRALWPDFTLAMNSMVLSRGFRIATKGPGTPDFETDLLMALSMPQNPQPNPNPNPNPTGGETSTAPQETTTP